MILLVLFYNELLSFRQQSIGDIAGGWVGVAVLLSPHDRQSVRRCCCRPTHLLSHQRNVSLSREMSHYVETILHPSQKLRRRACAILHNTAWSERSRDQLARK